MPDQDQIKESPERHQKLQHLHALMVDRAIKALETEAQPNASKARPRRMASAAVRVTSTDPAPGSACKASRMGLGLGVRRCIWMSNSVMSISRRDVL